MATKASHEISGMVSVMAGIVTYNPDIMWLHENVDSIMPQVSALCVIDNGSENVNEIENYISSLKYAGNKRIEFVKNGANKGIAFALNRLMMMGKECRCSWVITLDQDSIVPNGLVKSYSEKFVDKDVGIISPVIKDRNIVHKTPPKGQEHFSDIEFCITSASLTSVYAWEEVGGFDEKLFIDYVDHDFCIRIREKGFRILRDNSVMLSHAIGNATEKKVFGRWISVSNHSAFRKYYQIRNNIYLSKKYHQWSKYKCLRNIVITYLKVILFEDKKFEKLRKMNRGLLDGLRMK